MEDTEQLEIHLTHQFRKCSSTTSFKTPPNGISTTPPLVVRQQSIPDSGVYLQLDNCCPREPLLGPRSSSIMGLSKYAHNTHHTHMDSGCEHDDAEEGYRYGEAITKV